MYFIWSKHYISTSIVKIDKKLFPTTETRMLLKCIVVEKSAATKTLFSTHCSVWVVSCMSHSRALTKQAHSYHININRWLWCFSSLFRARYNLLSVVRVWNLSKLTQTYAIYVSVLCWSCASNQTSQMATLFELSTANEFILMLLCIAYRDI